MTPEELKRLEIVEHRLDQHAHSTLDGTTVLPTTSFLTYSLPGTLSQTAGSYGIIFTATKPCFVRSVSYVHTTAGTSPTIQVERLTGTQAPGAGTVLLTAAFTGSTTANTVQRGVLIAQTGLRLSDRLALKVAGTLTNYQGASVTIEIQY